MKAFIEIAKGTNVKYEFNHKYKRLEVDRFLHTPLMYPFNYGYIPDTLAEDGDPIDIVLLCSHQIMPGVITDIEPIGVLDTSDEAGPDPKIVCRPSHKIDPINQEIKDIADIPEHERKEIAYFFEHYKDLEAGKWIKVSGYKGKAEADRLISESAARFIK
ncbi:MAG: inorganic diphosphatase [Rickettsiales bacterium]|jgi:inorganic pyrophosphatase|nr:inorganic diphosphatase [Rickettsiales bacterium]